MSKRLKYTLTGRKHLVEKIFGYRREGQGGVLGRGIAMSKVEVCPPEDLHGSAPKGGRGTREQQCITVELLMRQGRCKVSCLDVQIVG